MAKLSLHSRTCGLLFILIFNNIFCDESASLSYKYFKSCGSVKCFYFVKTSGDDGLWAVSPVKDCSDLPNAFELSEVDSKTYESSVSKNNDVIYICSFQGGKWLIKDKGLVENDDIFQTQPQKRSVDDNSIDTNIEELVDISNDINVNYDIDADQIGNNDAEWLNSEHELSAVRGDIDMSAVRLEQLDNDLDLAVEASKLSLEKEETIDNVDVSYTEQDMLEGEVIRKKRQASDVAKIPTMNVKLAANAIIKDGQQVLKADESVTFALDLASIGNYTIVVSNGTSSCGNETHFGKPVDISANSTSVDVTLKLPSTPGEYQLCVNDSSDSFTSLGPKFQVVDPSETEGALVDGLRIEEAEKSENEDGVFSLMVGREAKIRLFGSGFTPKTAIQFTHRPGDCSFIIPPPAGHEAGFFPEPGSTTYRSAVYKITPTEEGDFYICVKKDNSTYIAQGGDKWLTFKTHSSFLPLWGSLVLILICLVFASLFSGLNLGLMSLDRTELKIIAATGTEKEKKYARIIQPVRDHGNFLLCSILFGNVAVINTHTVLLDQLMSGTLAVILSTLSVVLLSEIIPQAICSRHGLAIGAYTIGIMKAVMGITAPLAYPVSKLLDYMLGEEIGNVYNRERLKELVKVTNDVNDLDKEEVNIISGALELRKKKVIEVMTKIEDVYMLSIDDVLDFDTMSDIVKSGYSRIPVYEAARANIVTVLFVKDLALIDPDDNTPVRRLCQVYQNPCNFVFEDVTLDVMFKQFKEGHKGHMAFVHRINNQGDGDPFYEVVGLVTLEDVIEELIQAEIVDETDVFMDNRSKRRRHQPNKLHNFAAFQDKRENQASKKISNHLSMATFQYLSTTVEAFRKDIVSENVLKRILQQDIYHFIKVKSKTDDANEIYTLGKPADYFVLILEGRVEVTVGRESLVFEAGPFTYFGVQALTQNVGGMEGQSSTPSTVGSLQNLNMDSMLRHTFVPDYCVRATCDTLYIVIKRSMYLAAKRATLLEISTTKNNEGGGDGKQLDDVEVDKLLQEVEEEDLAHEKNNQTANNNLLSRAEELNKSI